MKSVRIVARENLEVSNEYYGETKCLKLVFKLNKLAALCFVNEEQLYLVYDSKRIARNNTGKYELLWPST